MTCEEEPPPGARRRFCESVTGKRERDKEGGSERRGEGELARGCPRRRRRRCLESSPPACGEYYYIVDVCVYCMQEVWRPMVVYRESV